MAIENAVIAKGIIGIGALGGVGGVGYKYSDVIKEMWNSENKSFLVQVSQTVSAFDKDFSCFDDETKDATKIDCSLFSLKTNDKKHIDSEEIKKLSVEKPTSTNMPKQNGYYKLRINVSKLKDKNLFDGTDKIFLRKEDKSVTYAKLKIIASIDKKDRKKTFENISKVQWFLGKVSSIVPGTGSENTFTPSGSETYQCSFNDGTVTSDATSNLQACSINKFVTTAITGKTWKEQTFIGTETAIGTSDTVKQNEHYLIKFTAEGGVDTKTLSGKNIIYLQTNVTTDQKKINFSEIIPVFIEGADEGSKNLLVIS